MHKAKKFLIGNYIECYSGFATDVKLRFGASSGGLITALLIFALKEKFIDGALVVGMKKGNPFEAEPFIARTEEEIFSAKGSKYCFISMNKILQKLAESNLKKIAVVGLPCQIRVLKQVIEKNRRLKGKNILYLGNFCNRTPSGKGLDFLLRKFKIRKGDVSKLDYRGCGWPGSMKICLTSGGEIKIPLNEYWNILGSDYFTPLACFLCPDHTAEAADLSFGDAWLPEFKDDKLGTSLMILRTSLGQELVKKASRFLKIKPIKAQKVIASQIIPLYLKKKNIKARVKLMRRKATYENVLNAGVLDYFIAFFY